MHQYKYGSGYIAIGDLIRLPVGDWAIYEVTKGDANKFCVLAQSYCTRTKSKVKFTTLFAHDTHGDSIHYVKIMVVTPAKPHHWKVKLRKLK